MGTGARAGARAGRGFGTVLLASAAVALALFALAEGAAALLLRHPGAIPEAWLPVFREYYLFHDRSIVQFEPACAVYDERTTYRLRPGSCRFRNREFAVRLDVNALGVRDDAASLDAPEIVVLGDSHAMGWGVAQSDSFPERLEGLLGRRVLNASVSSFGTARQVALLREIDRSRLRWLVVQYARNDVLENLAFETEGGILPTRPEPAWAAATARQQAIQRYRPGKHVATLARLALIGRDAWESTFIAATLASHPPEREAALFLGALAMADLPRAGLRVLVVEVNGRAGARPAFARALRARLARGDGPLRSEAVSVVSAPEVPGGEAAFVLDDHLRAEGHVRLAEAIARRIRRAGPQ